MERFVHRTDTEIQDYLLGFVPKNTQKSNQNWLNNYREFAKSINLHWKSFEQIPKKQLDGVLCKWILGTRTKRGEKYAPHSLPVGVSALMREWNAKHEKDLNFFKDNRFEKSRKILNIELDGM